MEGIRTKNKTAKVGSDEPQTLVPKILNLDKFSDSFLSGYRTCTVLNLDGVSEFANISNKTIEPPPRGARAREHDAYTFARP